jgi:glycosyltransferase involved in cell wall biosynthesis
MYKNHKIAAVVPAYNEEKLIGETLSSIPEYVDRIYAVDDGSTDRTFEIVQEFAKKDSRIVCIKHEKNRGLGAAIVTGYKRALQDKMDIVAVMAGDNQMDPKDLSTLLDPIVEGKVDFAKGNRFLKNYDLRMSYWRRFGTFLLTMLTKIASGYWHVGDSQNGYVAITINALKKIDLNKLHKSYSFENDLLIKASVAGLRVVNVPVKIRYKIGERSKIKYSKFMISTSWLLLKSFLWRIWVEYIKKGKLIGFLYLISFILIVGSFLMLLIFPKMALEVLIAGSVMFLTSCLWEVTLKKGVGEYE